MKLLKRFLFICLIISFTVMNTSCWNYKDVERLNIVMGFAIDKDVKSNEYVLTAEMARPESGQNMAKYNSDLFQSRGSTIYEAVRGLISRAGKKTYWAHTSIGILSKAVVSEDLSPVLDLFYRDPEVRGTMRMLVSKRETAKEIFEIDHNPSELRTTKLDYIMENEKSISKYPKTEYKDLVENFASKEKAILIPMVDVKMEDGKAVPEINGSAVLRYDRVTGYLTGDETQYALWVMGELKGGLLVVRNIAGTNSNISFEIYKNKTKVKPDYKNNELRMNVHVITTVDIGEVSGNIPFSKEEDITKLKESAQKNLKDNLEYITKKMQLEYKSDIFNFGNRVERQEPKLWKKLMENWNEELANLPVDITVDLLIKGSALTSQPVKEENSQ
jgi:spore germination protein KC